MATDWTNYENEDSQAQVSNLLDKINSGSIDGHGADSSDEEAMLEGLEKMTDFGIGGNHPACIG